MGKSTSGKRKAHVTHNGPPTTKKTEKTKKNTNMYPCGDRRRLDRKRKSALDAAEMANWAEKCVVAKAVSYFPDALRCATPALRADKDVVMAAVGSDYKGRSGSALEFAAAANPTSN